MRAFLIIIVGLILGAAIVGFPRAEVSTMNEYDLKTYTYGPVSGERPKQMVILLHGLGSDGRDLIGLAPFLAQALPDAIFVSPDAPYPCDMAPMGYQWFSLLDRSEEAMLAGAMKAEPILDHFITDQMAKHHVPADRIALVGFSQGTMMSLYVGPRYTEKLAGILGFSGALIGGDELDAEGIYKIPVHLIHGDADDVVPVERYHEATKTLKEKGFAVTGGVRLELSHSIDEHGLGSGAEFLSKVLR